MSAQPPRSSYAVMMPSPVDMGEPFSVGIATYRTEHELTYYLRALRVVGDRRMVVVLALPDGVRLQPLEIPENVRLILTALNYAQAEDQVGWYVPDPQRAVIVGVTGRQSDDAVILLFPEDWNGPSPEDLVEKARRWRQTPHSLVDDQYFAADHPN